MTVVANGKPIDLPDGATISGLIEEMGLAGRLLAAEVNGEAIARGELATTVLHDGDRVELVRAVAGG